MLRTLLMVNIVVAGRKDLDFFISLDRYINTYIHIYIHICIYLYVHVYVHVCMCIH